jgi:hypothetical protein
MLPSLLLLMLDLRSGSSGFVNLPIVTDRGLGPCKGKGSADCEVDVELRDMGLVGGDIPGVALGLTRNP